IGPRLLLLEVFRQAVRKHLRAWGIAQVGVALAEPARLASTARFDFHAQQPALDRAVPNRVRAVRANPQLETELRRPRQHRSVPTLESLAQHHAQFAMNRPRRLAILQPHAIRWVGAHQADHATSGPTADTRVGPTANICVGPASNT